MPANKPYPGENPRAAAKRIARNKGRGNTPPAARPPRPRPGAAPVATKGEMMGEGYEGGPMSRGRRRRPGYNFTRNLGNKPDVGY